MQASFAELMLKGSSPCARPSVFMSDRNDLSPYAPPDLTSYPLRLRREPPTEEDRRVSSWWWLIPTAIFTAGFLIPDKEFRGRDTITIHSGILPAMSLALAITCVIGSINSFRPARVAHEDEDGELRDKRITLGIAGILMALLSGVVAAVMFLPFLW